MSQAKKQAPRCKRCGWDGPDVSADHWECEPCRQWMIAMLDRHPTVSNTAREGFEVHGDTVSVDLWYPRAESSQTHIAIGLIDVRANDGLRLHYDFDRDGWVVEQPWTEEVQADGYIDTVEHWEEVGFFRAWALSEKNIEIP